jgi:hypothetical protein
MHIEADLDDTRTERLLTLQQRLNKSVSEIIADLIDAKWNQNTEAQANSKVSPIYQAFEDAGLIGCIATGEQLSSNYKDKMDFSIKTGDSSA